MIFPLLPLLLGFALDLLLGDPHGFPHPVVLIGRNLQRGRRDSRAACHRPPRLAPGKVPAQAPPRLRRGGRRGLRGAGRAGKLRSAKPWENDHKKDCLSAKIRRKDSFFVICPYRLRGQTYSP